MFKEDCQTLKPVAFTTGRVGQDRATTGVDPERAAIDGSVAAITAAPQQT
jgi:hypothetical protein